MHFSIVVFIPGEKPPPSTNCTDTPDRETTSTTRSIPPPPPRSSSLLPDLPQQSLPTVPEATKLPPVVQPKPKKSPQLQRSANNTSSPQLQPKIGGSPQLKPKMGHSTNSPELQPKMAAANGTASPQGMLCCVSCTLYCLCSIATTDGNDIPEWKKAMLAKKQQAAMVSEERQIL